MEVDIQKYLSEDEIKSVATKVWMDEVAKKFTEVFNARSNSSPDNEKPSNWYNIIIAKVAEDYIQKILDDQSLKCKIDDTFTSIMISEIKKEVPNNDIDDCVRLQMIWKLESYIDTYIKENKDKINSIMEEIIYNVLSDLSLKFVADKVSKVVEQHVLEILENKKEED